MKENALIFKKLLSNKRKIVITTHKGPDGDAMGSSLAILHILEKMGHNVHLIVPNNYADFLHWMPGNEKVVVFEDNEQFSNKISNDSDLIIMLDFNNLSRIGNFKDAISNSNAKKVLIDHHQDPDLNIADIILLGVSRTSKTPTSIYLANRGYKTVNIPLVLEQRIPEDLYTNKTSCIIGLIADPERLSDIRRNRVAIMQDQNLKEYTDLEFIKKEVEDSKKLFKKNSWPIIDVTRRSVEETAASILKIIEIKKHK